MVFGKNKEVRKPDLAVAVQIMCGVVFLVTLARTEHTRKDNEIAKTDRPVAVEVRNGRGIVAVGINGDRKYRRVAVACIGTYRGVTCDCQQREGGNID